MKPIKQFKGDKMSDKQTTNYAKALEQVIAHHTRCYDFIQAAAKRHHEKVMNASNHEQREAHMKRAVQLTEIACKRLNTVLRLWAVQSHLVGYSEK